MHSNLGHPSNHALARAMRVTGGSAAAVRAALQLRCDVCESQKHPGHHLPARLRTDREFGDTAATDLFVLADYEGNQLSFIHILDLASTFGVVAMIPSKHPKIVWDHFFKHWITPFGVPRRLIYDQGGEFEREYGQELEDLGCESHADSSHHSTTKRSRVSGMEGSGRHMQDDYLMSSASNLCLNSCIV